MESKETKALMGDFTRKYYPESRELLQRSTGEVPWVNLRAGATWKGRRQ